MGAGWRFATKVGSAIKAAHDLGTAVTAIVVLAFVVFVATIGNAFGIGWGAAALFAALFLAVFLVGAGVQRQLEDREKNIDSFRQDIEELRAKRETSGPVVGGNWTFTDTTFEHFGQFIGVGPPDGPGVLPMTPGLLEFERRMHLLRVLTKLYAASVDESQRAGLGIGAEAVPKEWVEARLQDLEETWRLEEYTLTPDPRELMANYEPPNLG